MAFFTEWSERLQASRIWLQDATQINDPQNYSKLTGTIDFLLNRTLNPNTIEVIQQNNSNAGQYRTVEVRYQPHWGTEDLVTTDASVTCDKNNQRRDYIASYNVNLFAHYKFTLEEDYLRSNTENGDSQQARLNRGFQSAMRVLRENMDSQILAKMAGLAGTNPAQGAAAGAYTSLQLLDSAGAVDVNNFDIISNDMEDNFMTGPWALIGLGNARKYFNRLAVGNVNTNSGVNLQEVANQFGGLLYKDQAAAGVLGDPDNVLVVYPGLTQLYGYNLYNGVFAKETPDSLIKGTMPDPVYPITWDYKISYDRNCSSGNGLQGAWVVEVFKYFDLFTVPTDAFGDVYGDLNGFNGIVGYEITQA